MQQPLRDLAISVSLANLCFLCIWAQIFSLSSTRSYFFDASTGDCLAVLVNVVLLGVAFWLVVQVARRYGSVRLQMLGRRLFFLPLLIPLNYARGELATLGAARFLARANGGGLLYPALIGIGLVASFAILRWRSRVTRAATTILFGLTAFVVLTFARAVWTLVTVTPSSAFADPIGVTTTDTGPGVSRRVVVLLFDEMDQRLSFSERPAGLTLPEFDRLRSEGFSATSAFPPGSATLVSMPALISGIPISSAAPAGPSQLTIVPRGRSGTVEWSTQPQLFSRARELGARAAFAGWYHPYCRILGASLSRCFWAPFLDVDLRGQRLTLLQSMRNELMTLAPWNAREQYILRYRDIIANAEAMLRDSTLDLVFVHIPVPHLPPIYDRTTRNFTLTNYPYSGYLDNLALADRTLGELRRTIEATGNWPRTAVVVTSDHWFRDAARIDGKTDHRVPLIVKLGSRSERSTYAKPINTVVIHDLVLTLLCGGIHTTKQLSNWLDQRVAAEADTVIR